MKKISMTALVMAIAGFGYQNYHGCCLAPGNTGGWVVTLDSTIVLKTTDGGAHWFEQATPATRRFFDVTCFDSQRAWTCGILGEITNTTSGGANWVVQISGLSKYATRIEFLDAVHGWTSCGDGVLGKTTDGGSYWEQVFTPFSNLPEFYGLSLLDTNNLWMVAGWPDSVANGQGLIVRSSDGGYNWDSVYQCTGKEDYLDVYFVNSQTGIVVGGNDSTYAPIIFRTANAGSAWNLVTAPGGAAYLRAVDFVGNNGWAVGRFGTIIHTTNAGVSWTFQANPATTTLFDVDFADALHGLACGMNIILYTTNGGQTWINSAPAVAEDRTPLPGLRGLSARPNPASGPVTIESGTGAAFCDIYDAAGKLVTRVATAKSTAVWSGVDGSGKPVTAGVYFVRQPGRTGGETVKIILQR